MAGLSLPRSTIIPAQTEETRVAWGWLASPGGVVEDTQGRGHVWETTVVLGTACLGRDTAEGKRQGAAGLQLLGTPLLPQAWGHILGQMHFLERHCQTPVLQAESAT